MALDVRYGEIRSEVIWNGYRGENKKIDTNVVDVIPTGGGI